MTMPQLSLLAPPTQTTEGTPLADALEQKLAATPAAPVFGIVADVHAGCDKFGMTTQEYLEPFGEFMDECRRRELVALVAGDLFHHRNPRVEVVKAVDEIIGGAPSILAAGNHDIASPDKANALYTLHTAHEPLYDAMEHKGPEPITPNPFRIFTLTLAGHQFRVGALDWPMLEQFSLAGVSLKQRLAEAAERLVRQMKEMVGEKPLDILFGHAHLRYGAAVPDGPGLLAGRDILLPADEVRPLTGVLGLGHVHAPDDCYVGSTQPTDLGDTTEKRYLVVSAEGNVESVPFKTAKRIQEYAIVADEHGEDKALGLDVEALSKRTILHWKVKVNERIPFDLAKRKKHLEQFVHKVVVSIERPKMKRRTQDLSEEQIAEISKPEAALDAWMKANGEAEADAKPAKEIAMKHLQDEQE